ncbi:MAG: virulence RhuM family protein [Planctomycetes bacterium]|nr:virulence RhuM family protein [Planctomycetota bacterium]
MTPQNVTLHLKSIYEDRELVEEATCKDYLQVRSEGGRQVSRTLRHYSLPAILAVGYRVRSHRGLKFLQSRPLQIEGLTLIRHGHRRSPLRNLSRRKQHSKGTEHHLGVESLSPAKTSHRIDHSCHSNGPMKMVAKSWRVTFSRRYPPVRYWFGLSRTV